MVFNIIFYKVSVHNVGKTVVTFDVFADVS